MQKETQSEIQKLNFRNIYESFDTTDIGLEPLRSYYHFEKTVCNTINLNGDWQFCYRKNDNESIVFSDTVKVPHCVQNDGYDFVQYTNLSYPIPFAPPFAPMDNPSFVYKKAFEVTNLDYLYYLNFDGVDSCYFVFINGKHIGYNTVSHNGGEFNISPYLKCGQNEIIVVVYKWCIGTYLEDQDKIRLNGIFRNVYILVRPKTHIRDFKISYELSGNSAQILVDFFEYTHGVTITLYYEDVVIYKGQANNFIINNIKLWNFYQPAVYKITFESNGEIICDQIVLRTVEIKDGIFLLNNKNIKIKGVNRHDSYASSGYYCSVAQMQDDLLLLKNNNINAIRTSHYPPAPEFLYLCEKYGFYVMDEADLETHGTVALTGDYDTELFDLITNDGRFLKHIFRRAQKLYERDKNRYCVLFWSIGNESGWGKNTRKCAEFLNLDKARITHYESLYMPAKKLKSQTFPELKLMSFMYPTFEYMQNYLQNKKETRPLLLCEYCHAMGNGPGDLSDYMDFFYKNDRLIGGFIWELNDHSIISPKYKNLMYGGDWGDSQNDSNFCIDGLLKPDHTPSINLAEVKNAYAPIVIQKNNDTYYVYNKNEFLSSDEFCKISYCIQQDGKQIDCGVVANIPPNDKKSILLPQHEPNTFITFTFTALCGAELGFKQLLMTWQKTPTILQKTLVTPINSQQTIRFTGQDFEYIFDKNVCNFSSLIKNDEILTNQPIEYNIMRAPIDNDRKERNYWQNFGLFNTMIIARKIEIDNDVINFACYKAANGRFPAVEIVGKISVDVIGKINFDLDVTTNKKIDFLPRFGLKIKLARDYQNYEYYGYGAQESYIDKHLATKKEIYCDTVSNSYVDYIKPQENSSHFDTSYLKINSQKNSLLITAKQPFSFSATEYSQEQLTSCAHNYELKKENATFLCLDYMMSGIGSNSCGPRLNPKYALSAHEFNFNITLTPSIIAK